MIRMVNQKQKVQHSHHVRTFFASLFGTLAVVLILVSILVVWLNRTLTDTNTFSSTVAPLVTKPAIQNFVAQKVSDQLSQNVSPQNLVTTLLPSVQTAGKTDQQLTALVQPVIKSSVVSIVRSPAFKQQWEDTVSSAHAQFISQIKGNSTELTLDLSPAINDVVNDLKQTNLAQVSNHISVTPGTGKLDIKGNAIEKARHFYNLFQKATLAIVAITILLIAASIAFSVHHLKTIRRILFVTGIFALLLAALLQAPSYIKFGSDPVQGAAAVAFAQVLFHNLQLSCLIIGIIGTGSALGSKLYTRFQH